MFEPVHAWVPEGVADLDDLPPRIVLHAISREGELPPEFAEVEFLVPPYGSRRVLERLATLRRLRVVHTMSAGVEWLEDAVPPRVTLCNARGARDVAVAEWIVAAILGDAKRLGEFRDAQRERRWRHEYLDEVAGHHVVVVGMGSIGRALEPRLRALGLTVQGVARRARPGAAATETLPDLLPQADYVVLLVPHTAETEGLFGPDLLDRMKPHAVLVNAARGPVVDTDALLERLNGGRLRAVLDVTDPEPLPPDHPLWIAPDVTVTPHAAGDTPEADRRASELLADQLRRYAAGRPLLNVLSGPK